MRLFRAQCFFNCLNEEVYYEIPAFAGMTVLGVFVYSHIVRIV